MRIGRTHLLVGLGGFAFVAMMAYWWLQTHAFYEETQLTTVEIDGGVHPVAEWRGIVSDKSPLLMRACFLLRAEIVAPEVGDARPEAAPGWFRCFNAETIRENLASGYAKAYLAARNDPPGYDRIVAIFPGGRSYMWRQVGAQISE
jgi:hypothetical protein